MTRKSLLIAAALGLFLGAAPATLAHAQAVAALDAGRTISEGEIARRLADLLQKKNGGRPVEIAFHGIGNDIELPPGQPAIFRIDGISFDERSGRFAANVLAAGLSQPVKVTGRATTVESMPVLKNRVAPGEVITRGDLEWKQVPQGRYTSDYIEKFDDMIGLSPKRPLGVGAPIRFAELGRPEAVSKNALVTMVATVPGMTITTTGRAIEAGGTGDVIQVMNLQSKKVLQATITGPNQVQVAVTTRFIAAN